VYDNAQLETYYPTDWQPVQLNETAWVLLDLGCENQTITELQHFDPLQ
jgi:hypothetical protein